MPEADADADFVRELTAAQLSLRLYAQSLLPGEPGAQDVAQLANATAWKKRADFTLGTNFKAWLFAIVRYEVLAFRKRKARDSRLVFGEELEGLMAADLESAADELQESRSAALTECLAGLRQRDRELLMHRYSQESGGLDEFAAIHGRSVGGLKVTLHRLRNALLACIEKKLKANPAQA
jgi:RNA polymerase sigma-70 factor, ECF subfamily